MSKRRRPGEIVKRQPGSCFVGAAEPELVRLTDESDGELHAVETWCSLCDDPDCQEWANVEIVSGEFAGEWMCHLSECQMEDAPPYLCEYRALATKVVWWVNKRKHLHIRVMDDRGVWCCGARVGPAPESEWECAKEVHYTAQHHPGLPVIQLEQAPQKMRRLDYDRAWRRLKQTATGGPEGNSSTGAARPDRKEDKQ